MFEFSTEGGATLAYAVDFAAAAYANISFFDASQVSIPFHLSLRAERGLAVVNRREGSQWQAEEAVDAPFRPGVNRVELVFEAGRITVRLNGAGLFDLGPDTMPGLATITGFSWQGAILPGSVQPGGGAQAGRRGRGELSFTGPFELSGWGFEPGAEALDLAIGVAGLAEPPVTLLSDRPEIARREGAPGRRIGVQAVLPGRVWQGVAPGAALRIRLTCNGAPCGAPLQLSRAEAMARIEAIAAAHPDPADEAFGPLLALEHLCHGGFLAEATPALHDWAVRVAETYGLVAFLEAAEPAPADVDGPDPEDAEAMAEAAARRLDRAAHAQLPLDQILVDEMRRRFARALRAAPQGADLMALLPELPPKGSEARRLSWLVLGEIFCAEGAFAALYARAAAEGAGDPPLTGDLWHRSVVLPFLWSRHRFDELELALADLVAPGPGWIATAPLAWVMRQLAEDPPPELPEATRAALVPPFLDFLARRAALYWERSACVHLTGALVALLTAGRLFPAPLQARLVAGALLSHGLNPGFWAEVDAAVAAGRLEMTGDLAAGRAAFARISAHATGAAPVTPEALARDLRFFERFGNPQVARFRLELLGPLGVARAPGESLAAALREGPGDPARAALRHLAFPLSEPPPPDEAAELAALSRQAIAAAHPDMAQAPYAALQHRASRSIAALLATRTEPAPEVLDALVTDLHSLARPRSGFLGLALALVLLRGLVRRGLTAATQRILGEIGAMRGTLTPEEAVQLRAAPAMASALYGLRQIAGAHPVLAPVLRYFPGLLADLPPRRPGPPAGGALPHAPALFDALVMVISCKPYLTTRIPAIAATWAEDLTRLRIPHIVVVGGATGEAQLDGHILHLPVADDYESLPQKVLAAIGWVTEHTPYAHVLKIDDDCFLDAEAWFHSQSWRKFAYYGRKLTRHPGQLDRVWHFAKSTSARGRLELDKSPEPSVYADGGSGYMLSRTAMAAVLEQAASPAGQRLIAASFLEDKLIGDLLARAGIEVADEDNLVSVQRRGAAGGIPVSAWANGFWPGPASGVKLVHLDSEAPQPLVAARRAEPGLWPKKLWPSYAPPALGANTNLLELVSPPEKLARLNAAPLAVVACVRNEMFMLPHFLAHYRMLGVQSFLIADNGSDDGTLEYLAEEPDVALFSVDSEYRVSQYGVAWQQAMLANLRLGRWSLVADADELVATGTDPETAPSLAQVIAGAEAEGADAFRLYMLDLYPEGPLSKTDFKSGDPFAEAGFCEAEPFLTDCPSRGPWGDAPTWTSALRHRLIPGSRPELFVAQKIALVKYLPWMQLSAGLHYAAGVKLASRELVFAHFKYQAEFRRKAQAEVRRRQHFNNAEEYRRYLALMSEGREVLYEPGLSVRWQDCPSVRRILAP